MFHSVSSMDHKKSPTGLVDVTVWVTYGIYAELCDLHSKQSVLLIQNTVYNVSMSCTKQSNDWHSEYSRWNAQIFAFLPPFILFLKPQIFAIQNINVDVNMIYVSDVRECTSALSSSFSTWKVLQDWLLSKTAFRRRVKLFSECHSKPILSMCPHM